MKKNITTHLLFGAGFFLIITLLNGWFELSYLPVWVGGLIGIFLPDLDHAVYVYFLRPNELTSQRASRTLSRGDIGSTVKLLQSTTGERQKLIFHTALFQIVFVIFAFLVVSSSGNMFGGGLVLGFMLHILVDQLSDLMNTQDLSRWFFGTSFKMDRKKSTIYWVFNVLLLFYFGLVL